MSKPTNAFCERVRNTPPKFTVPQITVSGQTAFMRECLDCNLMAPHKLVEGGSECGVCGKFTARFVPALNPTLLSPNLKVDFEREKP